MGFPLLDSRMPRVYVIRNRQKAQGSGRARPHLQDKAMPSPLNHGLSPFRFKEIPDGVSPPQHGPSPSVAVPVRSGSYSSPGPLLAWFQRALLADLPTRG